MKTPKNQTTMNNNEINVKEELLALTYTVAFMVTTFIAICIFH